MLNQQPIPANPRSNSVADLSTFLNTHLCKLAVNVSEENRRMLTRVKCVHIGPLEIAMHEGTGRREARRNLDHIRGDYFDCYFIVLPLLSSIGVQQDGRSSLINEGSFSVLAMSRPFLAFLGDATGRDMFSNIQVRIPGSLLRQRIPGIDECCGRRIEIFSGAGTIMKEVIKIAASESACLTEEQQRNLYGVVIDVIASAVLPIAEIGRDREYPKKSTQTRILERAKAFILANLSNPALKIEDVAKHCHVSVRYLHSAFATASDSVGSYIRERRLQNCRDALRNPAFRYRSVTAVCAMWGFNNLAHFSHAYKSRFGCTPSQDHKVQDKIDRQAIVG